MAFFVAGLFRLRQVFGADMGLPKAACDCVQEVACLLIITLVISMAFLSSFQSRILSKSPIYTVRPKVLDGPSGY